VTAAIFGLVGVVIGALITGGTNYVLQVRAERREIRAAARLMLQELTNTGAAIRYAIELNDREFLRGATSEDEWNRHHLFLARHLSDEEWDAVALAYGKGTVALVLLDGFQADQWQPKAQEIADIVDEGCHVLLARAHKKGSDAAPVISAATT
jgi:hypothetical protein